MAEIKPNVKVLNENETKSEVKVEEEKVETVTLDEEETKNAIRMHEEDFIQGLIDAAGYVSDETQKIEIIRSGKLYFAFSIRPLSEEEYDKCKKKHTKYVRNKQFGMKLPEETNSVKYRDALIYAATIDSDKEKLWDNRKVWDALRNQGYQIINGLDVIEYTLKAGEKDRLCDAIDSLSGYETALEEVAKN